MEYKKAICSKINNNKSYVKYEYKTISDAFTSYEKILSNECESKQYIENEQDIAINYEIMNMCNMLTNKYGEHGFFDKDNVYMEFLKTIKKQIKIEYHKEEEFDEEFDEDI